MKFIMKHGKSEKDIKNLRQEIEILRQLRHENIIQMLDSFETKTDFCVVTGEFALLHTRRVLGHASTQVRTSKEEAMLPHSFHIMSLQRTKAAALACFAPAEQAVQLVAHLCVGFASMRKRKL